jgi:tape measure domain-containing protein
VAKVDIGIIINAVNRASPQIRTVSKDVDRLGKSVQGTTGHMRAFHLVLASITGGIVVNFGKRIVQAAGSLQSLNIRLANVTGSFENANKTFTALSTKFASAPFDIEVVAQGFTKLAAAGLELDKTTKLTDALVNSVAAFGGTGPELERAFLGFSQVVGKGTLQMEELKQQISESVPIATRLMADQAGVSVAKFTDMVAKGLISADEAVRLFTEGASKAVGNFAESLGFTINGSLARIGTMFKIGLNNIILNTSFDERLTVIFRNIGDAVGDFLANINEAKIKSFFDWLRLIGNQAEKAILAFIKIGSVIGTLLGYLVKAIDFLPAEAIQFGIIGYFMFGRAGGKIVQIATAAGVAILTILSKMGLATAGLMESLSFGFSAGIIGLAFFGPLGAGIIGVIAAGWHAAFADSEHQIDNWLTRTIDKIDTYLPEQLTRKYAMDQAAGGRGDDREGSAAKAAGKKVGASFWDGIVGSDAQLKEVVDRLQNMPKVTIPDVDTTPLDKAAEKLKKRMDDIRDSVSDTIRNVSDMLDTAFREIAGDELGEAIAQINDKWGDTNNKLEEAIAKAEELNVVTHAEGGAIYALNEQMLRNDVWREKAILKQERLNELTVQQGLIQGQINRNTLQGQIDNLQNQIDPTLQFLSGTAGGQVFLQTQQQRLDLNNQILESESQIATLRHQMLYEQTPAEQESLNQTIASYQRLHDMSIQALNQLSAEGAATNEFWSGVGNAIFDNVESAIYGVIDGTMTWGDVMSRVFSDLTKLALEYLGKLIMIKAIEAATGAAGGMGGGNTAAALGTIGQPGSMPGFGFANGAAFNGMVKPFANGDIISGPTMFGVAGEAGTEAIMPLERIGGKLGVNAAGSGNDNYHFTIQAIDTQSGVEFLMQNMDSIVGGIRHRGRLNHGLGRTL